jgi:hypothetical protein
MKFNENPSRGGGGRVVFEIKETPSPFKRKLTLYHHHHHHHHYILHHLPPSCMIFSIKRKAIQLQANLGYRRLEPPEFLDIGHMKMAWLPSLRTAPPPLTPSDNPSEAESTPGP